MLEQMRPSTRRSILGSLIVVFVGLLAWVFSPSSVWLAGLSYDLAFPIRGDIDVEDVVIVSMDEDSYTRLKQDPLKLWDRRLHTRLVDQLKEAGAEAIVFDVLFASNWKDPAVDEAFGKAIRDHGNVVLAASHQYSDSAVATGTSSLITAVDSIGGGVAFGVVELPLDIDRVVREHYVDATYTNLAWTVASALGKEPGERVQRRWINYYGDRNAIRQVSYYQALGTNQLAPDFFEGKVVFIGQGYFTLPNQGADQFATALTRSTGEHSTGVEIQATILSNLLREDWLERGSWIVEFGGLTVIGIVLGGLLPLLGGWRGFGGAVLVLVVFAAGVVWLWSSGVWVSWVTVVGIQFPVGLAWMVLSRGIGVVRSGDKVPDHTLIRCVGKGAYGEVWLARNIIGVFHAVKIVYRDRFDDAVPYDREFSGIEHFMPISRSLPGFVQIFHVGRNDEEGFFYYVMDMGDDEESGQNIKPDDYRPKTMAGELARRGSLPLKECLKVGLELTEGMDRLHAAGLIHRDIKPSNVVYVRGAARFADIGLVTEIRTHGEQVTYLGTKGYIAPEGPGTPLGDVYSLGKVLYQASTGMASHLFPETPTRLMEDAHETGFLEFFEIAAKACANETSRRYQSAAELYADLKELAARLDAGNPPQN